MEEFELDENGYKKSKLTLEDLNDDKYSYRNLLNSERMWELTQNSELQSKKGKRGARAQRAKHPELMRRIASENGKKMGPIQGRKNVESGHLASITPKSGSAEAIARSKHRQKLMKENGTHNSQKEYICPTCNQIIKGPFNMKRWHGYEGEKCNLIKILNLIPDGTHKLGQLIKLGKQHGYGNNEIARVVKNEDWFEPIPIGSRKHHYKKIAK